MPRVRPNYLNSIIYLYRHKDDADTGVEIGGSGFLLEMESSSGGKKHIYAVTNAHVIDEGCPVIRVNLKQPTSLTERTFCFEFPASSWMKHDKHDLAVRALPPDSPLDLFNISFISMNKFLSQEDVDDELIGPGDDLFYVGRFMDHAGKWENQPSVRLGTISMLPNEREPIEYKTECGVTRSQVGFLVEARSRSGYSGSPVFMFKQTAYGGFNQAFGFSYSDVHVNVMLGESIWILGVDWGHIHEQVRLIDATSGNKLPSAALVHAGMMGVVPIWFLQEFLENDPRLRDQRARDDEFYFKIKGATGACD